MRNECLCREDVRQREQSFRVVFKEVNYIVLTGNRCALCRAVCRRGQLFTSKHSAGYEFEIMVEDLRSLLREFAGRKPWPTIQSTPESCARAGYDGAKRRTVSKVYAAVDMMGHLLGLHVTAASE